jgi:acyl-CoA thioester hydrolase
MNQEILKDDQHRFNKLRYRHWVEENVRFSDLDALGHVNNNAIGEYFENARAALFSIITPGWPWCDEIFVLAQSSIDFRHELHLPAHLRIGSCITEIGRTSMKVANALFHEENGLAYCENVSVLIRRSTRKPVALPEALREMLKNFMDNAY